MGKGVQSVSLSGVCARLSSSHIVEKKKRASADELFFFLISSIYFFNKKQKSRGGSLTSTRGAEEPATRRRRAEAQDADPRGVTVVERSCFSAAKEEQAMFIYANNPLAFDARCIVNGVVGWTMRGKGGGDGSFVSKGRLFFLV